jgi:hypothetical protein
MDWHTASVQQARVTSFLAQLLATTANGLLLSIQTARNVRSYFSGHYQKYGINIQACCDAQCRFTFLGVGGPGVTKDRTAIKEIGLYNKVETLPPG